MWRARRACSTLLGPLTGRGHLGPGPEVGGQHPFRDPRQRPAPQVLGDQARRQRHPGEGEVGGDGGQDRDLEAARSHASAGTHRRPPRWPADGFGDRELVPVDRVGGRTTGHGAAPLRSAPSRDAGPARYRLPPARLHQAGPSLPARSSVMARLGRRTAWTRLRQLTPRAARPGGGRIMRSPGLVERGFSALAHEHPTARAEPAGRALLRPRLHTPGPRHDPRHHRRAALPRRHRPGRLPRLQLAQARRRPEDRLVRA